MAFKAGAIYADAELRTSNFDKGLKSLKQSAGRAGKVIATAFAATMVLATKRANDFQKEMSNVSTLVDTSKVSMSQLNREIIKMNPALGNSTNLAKGLYQAYSAGAETMKEAIEVTKDSAKFAKAALTDTNTAVDVLTTAVNAYGKETMDTKKASDLFFTTIKNGKITGEELASTIGQSIPLFASAGIELEELTSGIAAMTKQGVNAANATTQLNSMVNAFLKPSEEMVTLLNEVGYASGSAFLEAEGLAGALKLIEENTQGDAAEMSKLIPNIRGLRGAMALTGVGGEEFNKTLEDMETAMGATNTAFEKQEKTWSTFVGATDKLLVTVGSVGKAFADQIAGGLTEATTAVTNFLLSADGMATMANIVGYVSGGFTALKEAFTPVVEMFGESFKVMLNTYIDVFGDLFEEQTQGSQATRILAYAMRGLGVALSIPMRVTSTFIQFLSTMRKDLEVTMNSVSAVTDFFKGDLSFSEANEEIEKGTERTKENWSEFGQKTKDIWTGLIEDIEIFGEAAEQSAENISVKTSMSFEATSNNLLGLFEKQSVGMAEMLENTTKVVEEETEKQTDEEDDEGKKQVKSWEDRWKEKVNIVRKYTDLMQDSISYGLDSMFSIQSQALANQEAEIELSYRERFNAIEEQYNQGLITEADYNEKKKQLEDQKLKEINKNAKKQFKNQKKSDIASVWMDAASSIAGWWSEAPKLGPIAGPIFAGTMTALTGAMAIKQSDLISKQKFVPAMASGGTATGGATRVNEQGGEILNLPDGTIVVPNDISKEIASGVSGQMGNVNFNFDGARISNDMDLDYITDYIMEKLGQRMRFAL